MTWKRIAVLLCVLASRVCVFAQENTSYTLRGTILAGEGKVLDDGVLEVRGRSSQPSEALRTQPI